MYSNIKEDLLDCWMLLRDEIIEKKKMNENIDINAKEELYFKQLIRNMHLLLIKIPKLYLNDKLNANEVNKSIDIHTNNKKINKKYMKLLLESNIKNNNMMTLMSYLTNIDTTVADKRIEDFSELMDKNYSDLLNTYWYELRNILLEKKLLTIDPNLRINQLFQRMYIILIDSNSYQLDKGIFNFYEILYKYNIEINNYKTFKQQIVNSELEFANKFISELSKKFNVVATKNFTIYWTELVKLLQEYQLLNNCYISEPTTNECIDKMYTIVYHPDSYILSKKQQYYDYLNDINNTNYFCIGGSKILFRNYINKNLDTPTNRNYYFYGC